MTEGDMEKAIQWLDVACEDQDAAWDFVCRLRNAMRGLNYEEGCPALDFVFPCIAHTKLDTDDD